MLRENRDMPDTSADMTRTTSTSKYHSNIKLTWETQSLKSKNCAGMPKHVDRYAWHCNTCKYSGNHQYWPSRHESPNSPTGSTRSCADEMDGLESCPGTLSIHMHVHGDRKSLRRCVKVSECQTYLLGGEITPRWAVRPSKNWTLPGVTWDDQIWPKGVSRM